MNCKPESESKIPKSLQRPDGRSSKLPLVLKPAPVRPGSEDFLRLKSRGV